MSSKIPCTDWFFLTITEQKGNTCPVILAFVDPRKCLVFNPEFRIPLVITYMNFKLKLTTRTNKDRT